MRRDRSPERFSKCSALLHPQGKFTTVCKRAPTFCADNLIADLTFQHSIASTIRGPQFECTWWAEQGLIVHSEFRDGNVPAGYEQLRVLEEAARLLPGGGEQASRFAPECLMS